MYPIQKSSNEKNLGQNFIFNYIIYVYNLCHCPGNELLFTSTGSFGMNLKPSEWKLLATACKYSVRSNSKPNLNII